MKSEGKFNLYDELGMVSPGLVADYIRLLGPEPDEVLVIGDFLVDRMREERSRVPLTGLDSAIQYATGFFELAVHAQRLRLPRPDKVEEKYDQLIGGASKPEAMAVEQSAWFGDFCDSAADAVTSWRRKRGGFE